MKKLKPILLAAAALGMNAKKGSRNMESRKSAAVVSEVRPVLPPAATPEDDSTNVVVVDVPRTAPADVATASARRAGFIFGSFPSLSSIFAFVLTPMSVPRVSKRSTNRNEKITTTKLKIPTPLISTLKHCPNVSPSLEKSVILKVGRSEK